MKCPICIAEGEASCVTLGMSFTTCMGWTTGYYNEKGNWVVNNDPNKTTTEYSCSNGHRWKETV